jgi:hypothetical protein
MQVHDPPPWEDAVSRKRVGFLLGCAAHGLQDELFDSLFLPQTHYHEQGAQDSVDPATDGFLAQAGHLSVIPEEYLPMDVLLSLYAELDVDITEAVIRESVSVLTSFYVNDSLGPIVAEALGEEYEGQLPWTQAHFLDPEVPGSLRSEILPTMLYLQAIWARLHGASLPEDTVVFWFPNGPRRLRSHDPASPDSWVTVVYGQGVHRESATASWRDVMGTPVSFNTEGTRWGATFGRLHRFMPTEALTPGGQYALTLEPGLARIDGGSTTSPFRLDFQVACTEPGDPECPAMVDIPEVSLDPPVPPTPFEPAPASRPSAVASDTPRSEGGCISGVRPGSTAGTWLVGCLLGLSLWRRLWRPGAVQLRA